MSVAFERRFPLAIAGAITLFSSLLLAPDVASAQGGAEAAPEIKANCNLTGKAKVVTSSNGTITTSADYVDMPDMTISKVKLKKPGCIIVQFSAEVNSGTGDSLAVRVFLDGAEPCSPFEVELNYAAGPFNRATRGMTFVCKNVTAGTHSLVMQWKRIGNAGNAFVDTRTMLAMW